MNKLIYYIFFCILFLSACSSDGGGSADDRIPGSGPEDYDVQQLPVKYYGWYNDNGFADADKNKIDDTHMCWAATASNLLTAAGWEDDEDIVFEKFKDHFENSGGNIYQALEYYFRNFTGSTADEHTVREYDQGRTFEFIAAALNQGKAVAIVVKKDDEGHDMSVYGYDYSNAGYKILFIADNNDEANRIHRAVIDENNIFTTLFYRDWRVAYAVSLKGSV